MVTPCTLCALTATFEATTLVPLARPLVPRCQPTYVAYARNKVMLFCIGDALVTAPWLEF